MIFTPEASEEMAIFAVVENSRKVEYFRF